MLNKFVGIKEEINELEKNYQSIIQFDLLLNSALQIILISFVFKLFFDSTGPAQNIEALITTRHTELLRENQNLRATINKLEHNNPTTQNEKLNSSSDG